MTKVVDPPPSLFGIPEASLKDAWRISCWTGRGLWYGVSREPILKRTLLLPLCLLYWPLMILFVPVRIWSIYRSRSRHYMSVKMDAVIVVASTRKGWRIEDHVSSRPGTGQGRDLRRCLTVSLLPVADAQGITIYGVAASNSLLASYKEDIPGLTETGKAFPRGIHVRRPPR